MLQYLHYIVFCSGDVYYPLGTDDAKLLAAFMQNSRQGDAITIHTLFNNQEVVLMRSQIIALEQTAPEIRESEREYEQKLEQERPFE